MSILTCPNCQSTLSKIEKTLKCQYRHSFDIGKGGYINLLLANKKKTLNPGDNKAMMDAREAFLANGHYDFLIEYINETIKSVASESTKQDYQILDIGCGTGYYTRNMLGGSTISKTGIDISKIGVSKASKLDKQSTYIVGSAFDLPIAGDSVDTVINIFAPADLDEVRRVLKPKGLFIKIVPSEEHMKEIASLVYESVIPHESTIENDLTTFSGFQLKKVESLEKQIKVSDESLYNLIAMTPYYYKFDEETLANLNEMKVTISFKVIVAKRDVSAI